METFATERPHVINLSKPLQTVGSKNLAFDHLILNPSPKGEGQKEFLEMP